MKFWDNVSGTQKLILIAFVVIVGLLLFNPPVAERVWQMVTEMTRWFVETIGGTE